MEFRKAVLDNGLEIIGEINEAVSTTAIGFFVKTGARDETDELSGVSHFLEHMLFKGTPTRTAADVNRELDEMGGVSNAFTCEDMTVYYGVVLPELQTRMVDLLTDLLRPSLRVEDFQTEKKVILEEIKMYEDAPPFGIDEKCRELFFAEHPLSRSVLGTVDSVSALTADQMRGYFDARYVPGNMTAVVSGNVDFDRFVRDIDARCGAWKPVDAPRTTFRPTGKRGRHIFKRENSQQEYVFELFDAPCCQDNERYASAILANILGDDAGSRIFWELVDNGRADSASFSFADFSDAGFYIASLCCAPEDVAENLDVLNAVLADAAQNGLFEEELTRAKNKLLSRLVLSSERAGGRLFTIGTEWTQTKSYFPIHEELNIVRNMTLDKLSDVLAQYPLTDPLTVAVGPLDDWK